MDAAGGAKAAGGAGMVHESGLPPTLPDFLIRLIGEYGSSTRDGASDVERLHRWRELISGIKSYAAAHGAASVEAAFGQCAHLCVREAVGMNTRDMSRGALHCMSVIERAQRDMRGLATPERLGRHP